MSEIERHVMPNGSEVFYKDASHSYWRLADLTSGKCSGRIPGISGIAKNDGDTYNDPLITWGSKLSCEGVARELSQVLSLDDEDLRAALQWTASGDSIWRTLEAEKLTWKHIREEAGQRGSLAHGILADLAAGRVPEPQSPYDEGVIGWWNHREPQPLHVEQVVYSQEFGFAGRFDFWGKVESLLTLLDLKSSAFAANSFAVQLNLYRLAAKEAGFGDVDRLMIVQVDDHGRWYELPVPIRPDWAMNALATYKAGREISAALRAAKKESRVAA